MSRTQALAGIALGLAVAVALALSLHAATGELLPFDRAIYDELQFVPGGHLFEPVANVLALGVIEYALLLGAAGYALYRNDRLLAASVVLVLIARTLNTPLKELIDRPRPTGDNVVVRIDAEGLGFPSGHASTVVLVYGYAAVVAVCLAPRWFGVVAAVLAAGVIALMGWDRVYDGAHWPSDVLGGYATGTALLIIALMLPRVAVRLWHRYVGHSDGRGLG